MKHNNFQIFWPAIAMAFLFLAAVFLRPVLPIDETRYMSVAWEMWLRHDWFAPLTVNFEPYYHKPPLLFWLINISWSIFGVSRWAGALPMTLAATACVYLTQALARKLCKNEGLRFENLPCIVIGSVPFLVYSTLVMFDITLTMFVLSALLALVSYAESRRPVFILAMALALGLGVLTKGPVAWLYVIFPVLFAPLWAQGKKNWLLWYGGCFLAFMLSLVPVALWLVPVLGASDSDFAFHLLWDQTAGRITGKMGASHDRPIYFYLPLLPVLFLPWAFVPSFWSGVRNIKNNLKMSSGIRFILFWIVPVIIAFSVIGGKQPHYLLPVLPGALILIAYAMKADIRNTFRISVALVTIFIVGEVVASQSIFKHYNLQPVADYVHQNEDKDWAFVRKYQGELVFLGRLQKSIDDEQMWTLPDWFEAHPQGMAVVRYKDAEDVADYKMVMTIPYRGKNIGVVLRK